VSRGRAVATIASLVAVMVFAAACGDDDEASATDSAGTTALSGELTVSAAASLREAFEEIGAQFEAEHDGTSVAFTFDSSGTLATQIREGAPADVFASADQETMHDLAADGNIDGDAVVFAANELVIVTKPGNPSQVSGLGDLAELAVVAVCVDTAPCGKLSARALDDAGVALEPDRTTEGQNVKATLAAVTEGDADAALVYATDARAAGDAVAAVEIEADPPLVTRYPIAMVQGATDAALAEAFIELVTSPAGLAVLEAHGFLPP
jgi:molybdate transport system substrate-binding protein